MEDIIAIDAAGRLVVPKAIRARLALREGSRLQVREEDGRRIILEPVPEQAAPVEAGGLLVIRGHLLGEIPDHRDLRTRRTRALARMAR